MNGGPKSDRAARLYLALALPVALLFASITPPFQVPDEVGHYWRAAAIARGQFAATMVDGKPGGVVPVASRDLVAVTWMELAGKETKYEQARIAEARKLRPGDESVRVSFPAFYTAVPYAPQAVALAATRSMPPLIGFRAARAANAVAGVLLIALAMRLLPAAAWVFGTVGLMPMFLFLAGSMSADVVTVGLAFCATAAALRRDAGARLTRVALPLVSLLLALAKPAYVLIPLLSLVRLRKGGERLVVLATMAATIAGAVVSAAMARAAWFPMRGDAVTDARAQLAFVLHHPFAFLRTAVADYASHGMSYVDHFVGRLGWLDVGLPRAAIVASLVLILYSALSLSTRIDLPARLLSFGVFASTLLVISLSQYVAWTPVGSSSIDGIQGRYFLPIAPALLLALSSSRLRWWPWAAGVTAVAVNATAVWLVAARYGVFG